MITIRQFSEQDSPEEIAALLRRAYAPLADRGLQFVATRMTAEKVLERLDAATCLVAHEAGRLIGTVMVYPPDPNSECELYRRPGVYHFGKFGVEPELKGRGLGRRIFEAAEKLAIEQGAEVFACDTAAPATDLIALYESWGFEVVGKQSWSMTNYESVVLAKSVKESP